MIVKNLTNEQQGFQVKELTGEHTVYDMYLQPNGSTELGSVAFVSPEKYVGILEISGMPIKATQVKVAPVVEPKKIEEPVVEEKEEVVEVESNEETTESFICDICGAEFASARGLNAHKNKAHAE